MQVLQRLSVIRNPALVLIIAAFCSYTSSCGGDSFSYKTNPPEDPGGYWVCDCVGFACFYYTGCYWVSTAASGVSLPGLVDLDKSDAVEITAPTTAEEFVIPSGQSGVLIGGTVTIPSSRENGGGKPRVVVINASHDLFWLAEVKFDPALPKGGHFIWETFASGKEGLLGPGPNRIRVDARDPEAIIGSDEITIVIGR